MSTKLKTKKIKISELKVGMKIKTIDGDGKIIFKNVDDVWNTIVNENEQVKLKFTNGTIINCSINHPIMVMSGYDVIQVLPQDLTTNHDIISDIGLTKLKYIKVGQSNDINYIDCTVDNTHTFFTASNINEEMILTHNSQGGVRGASATVFYPLWHLEVESLLVLKNNRGVEENRVRQLDYAVQFNKLMYERLIKGGNITLFSPHAVKGLYDAFFSDQELFEKLYIEAESNDDIPKKTVKAIELFSIFANERASTGRIYLQNVDHCNTNSPFNTELAPIKQSNLCLEIALPTKPLKSVDDPEGEIALCTLSAFNLAEISMDELPHLSDLVVSALDALLDYQNYPMISAELSTLKRRSLGIGVTNYATYLAKLGLKYSDGSANKITHELFERIQFNLIKASMNLAKEYGECDAFNETTYAQGIMPIDRYKKAIDGVVDNTLYCDWENLRNDVLEHGMRNSTLTALMPSETSSQVHNATNGIEPPRGAITVKSSKDGIMKQVVPFIKELEFQYEYLWNIPNNNGYLELVGIMQKFVDQSVSANTNYDPSKFEDGKVPIKLILQDILKAYKLGIKTLYYHNTRDGANNEVECEGCKI